MTAPHRVPVSEHFVISAVRYALGRATYIVGVTVDETIAVWPLLSENTRKVIARDVSSWLAYEKQGMACDVADWLRLMQRVEEASPVTAPHPTPQNGGSVREKATQDAKRGIRE